MFSIIVWALGIVITGAVLLVVISTVVIAVAILELLFTVPSLKVYAKLTLAGGAELELLYCIACTTSLTNALVGIVPVFINSICS